MRCIYCEYNGSCSVQEIAPDITGCEGHSKPRKLKPNECMCTCCKKIFDENSGDFPIFRSKSNPNKGMCFDCY